MDTHYLPDATDFTDIPARPAPGSSPAMIARCPKCQGRGKWNLRRDAYGPGKHFQAACGQCWGWGWVEPADATCLHTFTNIAPDQPFRCWHRIRCTQCGRTHSYSSDD